MSEPRRFKILKVGTGREAELELIGLPDSIPFAMVKPFAARAWLNHGQTLERLNERGGLSALELMALFDDKGLFEFNMSNAEAITRLSLILSVIPREEEEES